MPKTLVTYACHCLYCGTKFIQKAFKNDVLKCRCGNNLAKEEQKIKSSIETDKRLSK
jgi:hypothetical protein